MNKQFKIGESAIGGIIKVSTKSNDSIIIIQCLDFYSKKVVHEIKFKLSERVPWMANDFLENDLRHIWFQLTDLTTSYHSDTIIDYIKKNIKR